METITKDGFNVYQFYTFDDYLKNFESIEKKIWNYHNHHYRLNNIVVEDVSRKQLTNLERIFFKFKTKDGKELSGYAQANAKPSSIFIPVFGGAVEISDGPFETIKKEDVLSAKVGDIISIQGYFQELKHKKNIPIRYFQKTKQ